MRALLSVEMMFNLSGGRFAILVIFSIKKCQMCRSDSNTAAKSSRGQL